MKLSHPLVILFGAGATRGAFDYGDPPPPVDTDFFDIAARLSGRGTPRLAKKVLRDVWLLYGRTSGVSLEAYYRDLETRELIGRFAKSGNRPKDWLARRGDLEELIRSVMIHTTCDMTQSPIKARKSSLHLPILDRLKKDDTIITFNYDTVIEESFGAQSLWTPDDGYGATVHGKTLDWARTWFKGHTPGEQRKSRLPLLKLHGSLHWKLYGNKGVRMKPRPYVVRSRRSQLYVEKVSILPPGWNKQIDKNPYKQLWRMARKQLEGCKSLAFVGYSMPDTDLLARALFAEVVRHRVTGNKFISELYVADPNESVRRRLVDLFTPALGAHGRVIFFRGIRELSEALK
jgi:hypothetical protein